MEHCQETMGCIMLYYFQLNELLFASWEAPLCRNVDATIFMASASHPPMFDPEESLLFFLGGPWK